MVFRFEEISHENDVHLFWDCHYFATKKKITALELPFERWECKVLNENGGEGMK